MESGRNALFRFWYHAQLFFYNIFEWTKLAGFPLDIRPWTLRGGENVYFWDEVPLRTKNLVFFLFISSFFLLLVLDNLVIILMQ